MSGSDAGLVTDVHFCAFEAVGRGLPMTVVHFETEELGRLRRQEIRTHEFRVAANHNRVHDGGLVLLSLNLRVLVDWVHSRVFSR